MTAASGARTTLEDIGRAALAAVDARAALRRFVSAGPPLEIAGREIPPGAGVRVLALGKAAAGMAAVVCEAAGARLAGGLVVTKDGHAPDPLPLPVREAGHPIPDARSEAAARELLALASAGSPDDVLCVLLSGGASALTGCPTSGVTRADLAAVTQALLSGGADITETNTVRKHLSDLSGGRLAAAARAHRIEVLVISDVPGDALDVIGSGPCAPDASTYEDALAALARRADAGAVPSSVREHLARGARGEIPETLKEGDPRLARVRHTIVASNADALRAAATRARALGLHPVVLEGALTGEARDAAARLVARATREEHAGPVCFIAGGETTVRVRGQGRGGRNQELALAAALALARDAKASGIALLALGTDGTDGPTDAAGAYADAETVARGRARGVDARAALANNDAFTFFEAEGGLLVTGPTGTNVMDVALLLA